MSVNFDVSLESEEEENPVEDKDTVSKIQEVFRQQFSISSQECASLKKNYIKYVANSNDFSKVVAGVGSEMQVFDVTTTGLSKYIGKDNFGKFSHPISGVKFFNKDNNIVLASSSCGEITMYDLRSFKKIHTFEGKREMII